MFKGTVNIMYRARDKAMNQGQMLSLKAAKKIEEAQHALKQRQQLEARKKGEQEKRVEDACFARQALNDQVALEKTRLTCVIGHKNNYITHKAAVYNDVMQHSRIKESPGYMIPTRQEILRNIKEDLSLLKLQAHALLRIKDRNLLMLKGKAIIDGLFVINYMICLLKTIGATFSDTLFNEFKTLSRAIEMLTHGILEKQQIDFQNMASQDLMNQSAITLNLGWEPEPGASPAPYPPVEKKERAEYPRLSRSLGAFFEENSKAIENLMQKGKPHRIFERTIYHPKNIRYSEEKENYSYRR